MKAAVRLMRYLHGIHFEKYSRIRACEACEMSLRTADRAIQFLVQNGCIKKERGGFCTPAKVYPLMDLPEFLARYTKMARYMAHYSPAHKDNARAGASSEVLYLKTREERKPPTVENRTYSARMQAAMEAGGVGWGHPDFMAKVLDIATASGLNPEEAGNCCAQVIRRPHQRGKSEDYLLAALRSELSVVSARRRVG